MKKFIIINWGLLAWLEQIIGKFRSSPYGEEVELAVIANRIYLERPLCLPEGVCVLAYQLSSQALLEKANYLLDRENRLILNGEALPLGYCFSPRGSEVRDLLEKVISADLAGVILDQANDHSILLAAKMFYEHRKKRLVESGN